MFSLKSKNHRKRKREREKWNGKKIVPGWILNIFYILIKMYMIIGEKQSSGTEQKVY